MSYTFTKKEKRTSFLFTFAVFIIIFLFVILITNKNILLPKKYFSLVSNNSLGLIRGSEVAVTGIPIGKIYNVSFTNSTDVLIKFYIYEKYMYYMKEDTKPLVQNTMTSKGSRLTLIPKINSDAKMLAENYVMRIDDIDIVSILDYTKLYSDSISPDLLMFNIDAFSKIIANKNSGAIKLQNEITILYASLEEIKSKKSFENIIDKKRLDNMIFYTKESLKNMIEIGNDYNKIIDIYRKRKDKIETAKTNLSRFIENVNMITETADTTKNDFEQIKENIYEMRKEN